MPHYIRGITLTEMLLCVSLIGTLLMLGIPGIGQWAHKNEIRSLSEQYRNIIGFARAQAVTGGSMVTFCPSDNNYQCQGSQWAQGSLVFTDHNGNREIDGDDRLLRHVPASQTNASIRFSSFGNRQYLQFTPEGFTDYQNGNFTLCPASLDAYQARQLIITTTARVRLAQDTDGDGLREDSQGDPLRCP